ncbi:MAG: IPT/TIG domain-containing protein, partial [Myxococcota bacterium]
MTTIVSTRGRWYCAAVAYLLAVTALAATGLGCGDNESPVSDAAPEADTIEPEPDAGSEPELAITAISPQSAPLAGGIDITISGTGFVAEAGANTVVIGDRVSAEVTAMDSETLVARVPAGDAAGVVTVQVLNDNGSVSAADAFAYSAMPAITAITPDRADWRGGDLVTITGSGFAASAEPPVVRFGDSTADTVTVIDDSSLTAVAPQSADAFTIANVTVETASGTSAPAEFRYFGVGLLA